jgi:hypothetical protein
VHPPCLPWPPSQSPACLAPFRSSQPPGRRSLTFLTVIAGARPSWASVAPSQPVIAGACPSCRHRRRPGRRGHLSPYGRRGHPSPPFRSLQAPDSLGISGLFPVSRFPFCQHFRTTLFVPNTPRLRCRRVKLVRTGYICLTDCVEYKDEHIMENGKKKATGCHDPRGFPGLDGLSVEDSRARVASILGPRGSRRALTGSPSYHEMPALDEFSFILRGSQS